MAQQTAQGGKGDPNVKPSGPSTTQNDVDDPNSPVTGEKGMGAQEESNVPVSSAKTVYVVNTGETTLPEFESESDAEKHAKWYVKSTGRSVTVTNHKRYDVEDGE